MAEFRSESGLISSLGRDPAIVASAGSLLISCYTLLVPGLPNDDAYVYVRTAQIFLEQGLTEAFLHYSWAGLSVLMGFLSQLGLTLFQAGYAVNAMLFSLLSYVFVRLLGEFTDDQSILWLAVPTILLYPELNEFRFFIIRDVGFWTFTLTGIWQLLRCSREPGLVRESSFVLCLLAALMFRIEALLYLFTLPLTLLFCRAPSLPLKHFTVARLIGLSLGALLLGSMLLGALGIGVLQVISGFAATYLPFLAAVADGDAGRPVDLSRMMMGETSRILTDGGLRPGFFIALVWVIVATLFNGLSGAYFWALAYGLIKRYWSATLLWARPLLFTILVNTVLVIAFLLLTRFLTSRYMILLCLLLALQLPFVVARYCESFQGTGWERLGASLIVFFFSYCLFDAYLSFGDGRSYLLDAARYVEQTYSPETETFSNSATVAYFSGRIPDFDETVRIPDPEAILSLSPGSLVALELIPEVRALLERPDLRSALQPAREFPDGEEARFAVFRRIAP